MFVIYALVFREINFESVYTLLEEIIELKKTGGKTLSIKYLIYVGEQFFKNNFLQN